MVKLKEIPRTAAFAWSPGSQDPLIVTGTVAGAVDADFSSTTKLELWNLNLIDRSSDSFYLEPTVSIDTDARFYDIAWGSDSSKPHGIIAGALESGILELWDAGSLIEGSSKSFAQESKHSGPIKAVEFNPIQKHLIATGGASGEIFIWDVNSLSSAFAPGRTPTRNNDVDAIAWNNSVSHILASGSSEGTSIWDLKNRKEVIHLNFQTPGTSSRNLVNSIAWHPDNSTTLVTASSDEVSPVILTWDLRNSNAPLQIIQGHDKGVLSVDWCKKDATFLLSSGKDNRAQLWDPLTGEKISDYPVSSNWNFQSSFNPNYPDIFASASFDGKICIQTLQDTNNTVKSEKKVKDEEFWSSNNYIDSQHPTVSLAKAPKWLGRPSAVSFGFGGQIVSVAKTGDKQSVVKISKFSGDESLLSETSKLAAALESGSVTDIISEQVAESKGTDNFDWSILELVSKSGDRKEILKSYISDKEVKSYEDQKTEAKEKSGENDLFGSDQEFLSILSLDSYKPTGTFKIYKDNYSSVDKAITKAILSGDLEKAVSIAIKEDRLPDAFAIASRGSEATRVKVQNAYLSKNAESKPYLRLLYSVGSKDLTDIVENSDVSEWKDILNTIISLADTSSYNSLITALGDRLLQAREALSDKSSEKAIDLRNSAVICFTAAQSLASISKLWIGEIADKERLLLKDGNNELTPYSAHVKALHSFIEKISVFCKTSPTAASTSKKDSNLAKLYDTYRDYANIVATQGQLSLAETYLNMIPSHYDSANLERDRVLKASNKTSSKAAPASNKAFNKGTPSAYAPQAASGLYTPDAPQTAGSLYTPAAPQAANPFYTPAAPAATSTPVENSKPFQRGHARGSSGIFTPSNPIIAPYQPPQNLFSRTAMSPPPPPTNTQLKNKSASGWNDLPATAISPARKMTPAIPAATSTPFGNAPAGSPFSPPSGSQYGAQFGRQTPQPLAPPPSASMMKTNGTPSRQMSPAPANAFAPPPTVNDKYAPAKPSLPQDFKSNLYSPGPGQSEQPGPTFGRQTPNAFAPPPNPYANLAPAAPQSQPSPYAPPPPPTQQQQYGNGPQMKPGNFAPQNGFAPPPINSQYAPIPQSQGQQQMGGYPPSGYAPPPFAQDPFQQQQQQQQQQPAPVSEPEPEPQAPRHPAGDRSHIPASSLPIYEILSQEVASVEPHVPPSYSRQLSDAKKRLDILFDHLNNEELLSDETVTDIVALAEALKAGDFDTASEIQLSVLTSRSEECGQWMVGVKRLIDMCRVLSSQRGAQ